MRQIVLDTETTGLSHENGHRIIEIGCVEMVNRRLTGNYFHAYLNPGRKVDPGAYKVHGISNAFLQDKPGFVDTVHDFIQYVDGSELIIHNAPFDTGFLNAELALLQWPRRLEDYVSVLDTLVLARKEHPGQRNTLDALCKRYNVDNSDRELHGALLDARILALVYLAMTGGQADFFGTDSASPLAAMAEGHCPVLHSNTPVYQANEEEMSRHREFVRFLVEKSGINLFEW